MILVKAITNNDFHIESRLYEKGGYLIEMVIYEKTQNDYIVQCIFKQNSRKTFTVMLMRDLFDSFIIIGFCRKYDKFNDHIIIKEIRNRNIDNILNDIS